MTGESVGIAVAFSAGLFSFLSPCVLPLFPSYVSFITGMSVADLTADLSPAARRRVLIHAVAFVVWMVVFEKSPWPTLTLVVSLEAIFLSTFVMIGQNRQAAFQQTKANHDFNEQELELKTNTELTREIHALTTELHRRIIDTPAG